LLIILQSPIFLLQNNYLLPQLNVLALFGVLQLPIQFQHAFFLLEEVSQHVHLLCHLNGVEIRRDSIFFEEGVKFLLECFVFLSEIGALGPEFGVYEIEFFLFFLLFRAEAFEDGVLLLLLLEDVLVGDEDLVLFVLEVVVLAGQLVDLVLEVEAVGLVQEGVVVLVQVAYHLLLLRKSRAGGRVVRHYYYYPDGK
jgi:hypothetical protein